MGPLLFHRTITPDPIEIRVRRLTPRPAPPAPPAKKTEHFHPDPENPIAKLFEGLTSAIPTGPAISYEIKVGRDIAVFDYYESASKMMMRGSILSMLETTGAHVHDAELSNSILEAILADVATPDPVPNANRN